ncbi:MAG: SPFH domain-containing protein [Candidatus Sumerlaeota bacterium]|nr:SPFH domain-containing protein [Candidatus Sumerlaeota bacterium]
MTHATSRLLMTAAVWGLITGCIQIKYDQTGVRTHNFGPNKGIVDQDYSPGFHRFLWPLDTWHVLPSTAQHIHFSKEGWSPVGPTTEPLNLTSAGGDRVVMTAEVLFRIADGEAHHVLQESGPEERYREVVRGLAQDAARVQFGRLPTEDFYNATNREKAREEAANVLRESLKPRGIELVDFLVETIEFDPNYENLIKQKKIADQQVLLQVARGKAAEEAGKVDMIKTQTNVKIQKINQETEAAITQKGTEMQLQIASLQAEASKYAKQKDAEGAAYESKQKAEGEKLIKDAEAEGARRMNEALSGEGGRNVVALEAVQQMNLVEVTFPSVGFDWFNPTEMAKRLGGLGGAAMPASSAAVETPPSAPAASSPAASAPAAR